MKKITTIKNLFLIGVSIFSFVGMSYSQVNMVDNFDAGLPAGWAGNSIFANTSANNCGTPAMAGNYYSFNTTGDLTTATATADGGQIDISFDYKIVNWNSNTATSGNWGTITLEHTINGGTSWDVDTVINETNHVPANVCATVSTFTTAIEVPAASTVQYRWNIAWISGDYDLYIDNASILEVVSCPAPTDLTITGSDLTSGSFNWLDNAGASEWLVEYGSQGYVFGNGTNMPSLTNPDTITGLASDSFYDVYVQAVCAAGDSSAWFGPVSFNTYNQGIYIDQEPACPSAGYIDISATGVGTGLGDDGTLGTVLPFSLLYQGTLVDNVTIANNGYLLFGTLTGSGFIYGGVMTGQPDGIFPFNDDLDSEEGNVYYETIGTPGNQTFIVQWETRPHFSGVIGQNVTFQIQIEEATNEIYFLYEDTEFGGSQAFADFGADADIGVAGPQDLITSSNDATFLTNNTCAHFFYTDCPAPTNFSVSYTTTDEGAITWSTGLASETAWTVIYGVAGFNPLIEGVSVTTSTPALIMPGLDDVTCYDVYIYADCTPSLQSNGYMGTFCTLPNCSDPTGVATATAEDTVMTDWSWVESSGVGTYPSTAFGIEYGWAGYTPGTGTMSFLDNNFTDTTADVSLLGGGVYEMYVQAVCGTDSSNWVGPVTFIMPLSNDTVCSAEMLNVDGTVYIFDNNGATVTAEETASVTPPTTGFNGTDLPMMGWGPLSTTLENTTWFTFVAPASGNMRFSGTDEEFFASQIAIFETDSACTNLSAFNLVAASDQTNAALTTKIAPNFTICGLTPGNTYYILHDSWSNGGAGLLGQYSISLTEIDLEAGSDNGLYNVCLGDTVDLYNNITGNDAGGTWTEEIPTANFADPLFVTAGLASQIFYFQYDVVDGCASDSIETTVEIYAPSSAGIDGVIDACMNEPVELLAGLGGNVDHGGTWYDPSNTALPSGDILASSIPGQFNYDYVAGNGVCPDDTANVIVNVDFNCDYLNLQELYFNGMDIHPNPTTGIVYVSNLGSDEVFNLELTDLNGKVITTQASAVNGTETSEVNLTDLETGIYMIRVFNDNAEKTFRVVKQ